jgi:hypothetical protein
VGIGTTSPATKFNVEGGNIRASATTNNVDISPNGVITITSASGATIDNKTGTMFMQSPSQIIFRESGGSFTEWVRVKSTGFGVGVDPTQKLDVDGRARIRTIDTNASPTNFLTDDGTGVIQKSTVAIATASGTTNYIPKFTGTSTLGNSQIVDNAASGVNVGAKLTIRDDGPFLTGANIHSISSNFGIGTTSVSSLQLFTNNVNRLHINSAGDVGIGTTSPALKLHVEGGMRVRQPSGHILEYTNDILYNYGGSGNYYQYISGADYILANRTATGALIFGANTAERMRIFANGRVGINTTTDAGYQLDIAGSLRNTTGAAFATTGGGVAIGATSMDYGGQLYISGPNNQSNRFIMQSISSGGA